MKQRREREREGRARGKLDYGRDNKTRLYLQLNDARSDRGTVKSEENLENMGWSSGMGSEHLRRTC